MKFFRRRFQVEERGRSRYFILIMKNQNSKAKDTTNRRAQNILRLVAATALLCLMLGSSGSETAKMKGAVEETHHSKLNSAFTYAVYRQSSGCDETAVLYYFHGYGGDANSWYTSNAGIMDEWKKKGVKPPIVVALTFGPDWLMLPADASDRSVRLEDFVNELMPEVEAQLGGRIHRRLLFGFSIGGANVAQLLFRYPELFEKAVIASPQVYPFSVFEAEEKVDAFIKSVETTFKPAGPIDWIKVNIFRHDTVAKCVREELSLMRRYFQDPEAWARADILANMRTAPLGRKIGVYVSCGRQDINGFFPGAQLLEKTAASRGYDAAFDPLEGGHLSLNEPRIADFLAGPDKK